MNVLKTNINTRAEEFSTTRAAMRALVDDLRARGDVVRGGGGPVAAARHTARGTRTQ